MSEITAAGQEQTAGIEHINRAVGEMDEATQQNAALVEEASAAAQALQDQAAELARAVRLFRIDDSDTQALQAPARRLALPA
jgi:methyl-accepting chemotaxis protein-2 (aspartate sensor receptor)